MAEALYRKYRPQVFEDVVGQEPIERTLKNALAQDKVSHAYLFCGPRGTGKTTTARLLAKALLCEAGPTPDPDGTCEDCRLIAGGSHPDVYELDAASRTGVDNVREEIISRVQFAPTRGRFKVYIIDEVHMLSTAAFNALLKTLEEPPSHVVFVLCTTDPQKVPDTIHSRCQRFDFRRISPEAIVSRLGAICIAEDVEFDGAALDLIAHRAEGGLRNALTSLEQIIAFENGKVTLAGAERLLGAIDANDLAEIMEFVGTRDIASCFRWTAAYVETGEDLAQFVRDMTEHVRNLYVLALAGDDVELDVGETARRELTRELAWFGPDRAGRLLGVLGDLGAELKTTSNPRLAFEVALTRMVRPDSDLTLEALAERVEALESGYSAVAHVLPGQSGMPGQSGQSGQSGEAAFAPGASEISASSAAEAEREFGFGDGAVSGFDAPSEPMSPSGGSEGRADKRVAPSDGSERAEGGDPQAPDGSPAQGSTNPIAPSEAASAPARASASRAASLANPAALQRVWKAVLADLKKKKQAYGVFFMNAKAVFDADAQRMRIVFPAEYSFAFNAVQKPEVQDALDEALSRAVGQRVAFVYEQQSDGRASRAEASPQGGMDEARLSPQARTQPQQPEAARRESGSPQPFEARKPAISDEEATRSFPDAAGVRSASGSGGVFLGEVPYEEVPYEEVPYEEVPYEEFDAPAVSDGPARALTSAPEPARSPADAVSSGSSASGTASASHESPDAVQAMLQASFGSGVVLMQDDDEEGLSGDPGFANEGSEDETWT